MQRPHWRKPLGEGEHSYQSYLLRLWQDPLDEGYRWRAALEDPTTGEKEGFTDLKSLFDALRERTEEAEEGDEEG